MFFGSRIAQAREYGNLTQTELADKVGVAQATIADLERGRLQPGAQLSENIALALGFPLAFFEHDVHPYFAMGTLEFRAKNSLSARLRKHAHQYAHIVFEMASFLARRLKMPTIRLPRLSGDPEEAAKVVRSELGVSPDAPLRNLSDVLERSGVFVFALPSLCNDALEKIDGFSVWAARDRAFVPSIFVSSAIPGDRERFTIGHEVGELTLQDLPPGPERERSAHRFASAFLMPADRFREAVVPPLSIIDFVEVKKRYGVSIQAALVRARQLNIIDERRYHALYQQLSARGWRREEPQAIAVPREKPRGLSRMAELLYGDPIDFVRLAADVNLDPWFLRQLLAAHATKSELQGVSRGRGKLLTFAKRSDTAPEAPTEEAIQ